MLTPHQNGLVQDVFGRRLQLVETNGGNHKTPKAWKAEHCSDEVESWLTK
ncbi:hypothetical protein [Pseudomonas sp. S2_H01]